MSPPRPTISRNRELVPHALVSDGPAAAPAK